MGEADGFKGERKGAVPSSQLGIKYGMVKDSNRNGMVVDSMKGWYHRQKEGTGE